MTKMKIRKGDTVVVTTGRDKGVKGEVLKVLPEEQRVVVQRANLVKKHRKPTQANPQGGIDQMEAPIHVSNVALVDPESGKATRVGIKVEKDGKKVRVARRSGAVIANPERK